MFVSPQNSYVEIPISNVVVLGDGAFGMFRSGGRALVNGISDPINESLERSLISSTTYSYSAKTAICEPESRFSSDNETAIALILDLPDCSYTTPDNKICVSFSFSLSSVLL